MEEFSLKELFDYYKSKIIMIVLIILSITIIGAAYVNIIHEVKYTSSTTLILVGLKNNTSTGEAITQDDISVNQKLANTYQEIAKSRRVVNEVIESLKLDITYEELASNINVTVVNNTEIIKISVTNTNRKQAYLIAQGLALVFSKEVAEIYNVSNTNILDEADVPTEPSTMSPLKQMVIFILVGIVVAIGSVFVLFYFDTTIKSIEQIENKLGYPVLGGIPDYRRIKKGAKK
jgi:capsular polysaccharide biosynthesis protein